MADDASHGERPEARVSRGSIAPSERRVLATPVWPTLFGEHHRVVKAHRRSGVIAVRRMGARLADGPVVHALLTVHARSSPVAMDAMEGVIVEPWAGA